MSGYKEERSEAYGFPEATRIPAGLDGLDRCFLGAGLDLVPLPGARGQRQVQPATSAE